MVYFDEKIKDFGSLMTLIEHLGFLSKDDIKSDFSEDDIEGKQWAIDTYKRVDLNLSEFDKNYYFKKYKIREKIQDK